VWNQLKSSDIPPSDAEMSKWESEFNQLMRSGDEDFDYDKMMKEAWEHDAGERERTPLYDDEGIPQLSPYSFGKFDGYTCEYSHLTKVHRSEQPLPRPVIVTEPLAGCQGPARAQRLAYGGWPSA
jgi:hypothetical protein